MDKVMILAILVAYKAFNDKSLIRNFTNFSLSGLVFFLMTKSCSFLDE